MSGHGALPAGTMIPAADRLMGDVRLAIREHADRILMMSGHVHVAGVMMTPMKHLHGHVPALMMRAHLVLVVDRTKAVHPGKIAVHPGTIDVALMMRIGDRGAVMRISSRNPTV